MKLQEQKKYISKFYKSSESFRKALVKDLKNLGDYISVGGVLYTMESYDCSGKEVVYTNKSLLKSIICTCENRYHSTSDMKVEQVDNICYYRNNIHFAE